MSLAALIRDELEIVRRVINDASNDLLQSVGISENEAEELTGVNTTEMRHISEKWAPARKWS